MAFNFADLKKKQGGIEELNKAASKFKSGNFAKDERYWRPEIDKAGDGGAVIRFLPRPDGEDLPFVRKFSYSFKGPTGKWFIENSPATLDLPCPVMEHNSELWNSGEESNKEIARARKRRLSFISNVLVIKHKARPSDEGKVFLFEYGKKIWDKLDAKMNPSDEDKEDGVEPMNPFCLWEGANFRLRIKKVAGFTNYDDSEFAEAGALSRDDQEMEKIWRQCHSLSAEIAPDKFKSYAELKAKLFTVVPDLNGNFSGGNGGGQRQRQTAAAPQQEAADDVAPWEDKPGSTGSGDELSWFQDLANNG